VFFLAWTYVILKCKEKTTPAMDTCAKWTGGILFFAFCAFIIFCMVFLIVGDRIKFYKNSYEELKSNREEIVKYCDDHPNATVVKGGDR
jgi:competence transcription factor ComK